MSDERAQTASVTFRVPASMGLRTGGLTRAVDPPAPAPDRPLSRPRARRHWFMATVAACPPTASTRPLRNRLIALATSSYAGINRARLAELLAGCERLVVARAQRATDPDIGNRRDSLVTAPVRTGGDHGYRDWHHTCPVGPKGPRFGARKLGHRLTGKATVTRCLP